MRADGGRARTGGVERLVLVQQPNPVLLGAAGWQRAHRQAGRALSGPGLGAHRQRAARSGRRCPGPLPGLTCMAGCRGRHPSPLSPNTSRRRCCSTGGSRACTLQEEQAGGGVAPGGPGAAGMHSSRPGCTRPSASSSPCAAPLTAGAAAADGGCGCGGGCLLCSRGGVAAGSALAGGQAATRCRALGSEGSAQRAARSLQPAPLHAGLWSVRPPWLTLGLLLHILLLHVFLCRLLVIDFWLLIAGGRRGRLILCRLFVAVLGRLVLALRLLIVLCGLFITCAALRGAAAKRERCSAAGT